MLMSALQDLRYAVRTLIARPSFTLATALTLALGIGATVAIFSIVDGVLLRPLPLHAPDQLVVIWDTHPRLPVPFMVATPPRLIEWRNQRQLFDEVGGFNSIQLTMADEGAAEELTGAAVTEGLLPALGVSPALGRFFIPNEFVLNAPRAVILSQALWRRRFGADPSLIGRTIDLSGAPYTVVGIMPERFNFLPSITIEGKPPLARSHFWIPQRFSDPNQMRGAHFLVAIARLRREIDIETAEARLRDVAARLAREHADDAGWSIRLVPVVDQATGANRTTLLTLLGAVFFVLLLACTNVANLFLARNIGRRREMAIRTALGAGRLRLARQLFTEAMVLSGVGGLLGVLVAAWGVRFARAYGPLSIARLDEAEIDARVLLFAAFACIASAALFGLAPMLQMARPRPVEWLKERAGEAGGPSGGRIRGSLVVLEVAFSLILLAGGGLLLQSFQRLRHSDPGFSARQAVTFRVALPQARYPTRTERMRFTEEALRRLSAAPGVEAAGAIDSLPIAESRQGTGIRIDGAAESAPGLAEQAGFSYPTPGYFEAIGLPLLRGRTFTERDREGTPSVAIINDRLARALFGTAEPIGRRVQALGRVSEIVGVVGNEHHVGLQRPAFPNLYVPYAQGSWSGGLSFVVRSRLNPAGVENAVRAIVRTIDSGLALYNVQTIEEVVSASVSSERFATLLLGAFALAALLLAFIGIYGVTEQAVSQRRHEIGVRIALGAEPRRILALVLGGGARLTAIGVLIGLAAAIVLSRFISTLLFEVSPLDPGVYAVVVLVLVTAALTAGYLPARRATQVDAMHALREE